MNKIALFVATALVCISVGIEVSALPQSEFYPPWWINPGGNGSTANGPLPFQNFPQGEGPPIRWFWRKWISSILRREELQVGNFTKGNSSTLNDHRRLLAEWWKSHFPRFNRNGSIGNLSFIPPWFSSNGSIANGSLPFGIWGGGGPPMWWIWRNRISSIFGRSDFRPGNFTNGNWSRFIPPWLRNGSLPIGIWQGPPMWRNRRIWLSSIFGQHGNITNENWARSIAPWFNRRNGTFGNGTLPFGGEGPPMLSIWRNWISSILSSGKMEPGSNNEGNHHRRPYGGWWRYILPWNGYGEWNSGNHTNGNWTYSPPGFITFWRRWLSEMGNNTSPSTTIAPR